MAKTTTSSLAQSLTGSSVATLKALSLLSQAIAAKVSPPTTSYADAYQSWPQQPRICCRRCIRCCGRLDDVDPVVRVFIFTIKKYSTNKFISMIV